MKKIRNSAGAFFLMLCLVLVLGGCSQRELEDSSYPMALGIDQNEEGSLVVTFGFTDLSQKSDQNGTSQNMTQFTVEAADFFDALTTYENNIDKGIDCNHIRALILGKTFMESEQLKVFLQYLQKEEVLARNILLFVSDDSAEEIFQSEGSLDTSLGEYLEGIAQNNKMYKENSFVTIGTLLKQLYSQNETIMIPVLFIQKEMPVVGSYRVMQQFQMGKSVEPADYMMSMLLQNQQKKFAFYLKNGELIELTDIRCSYQVENVDQIPTQTITIAADAELMNQIVLKDSQKEKETQAEKALKDLLEERIDKNQAEGIDLSNSYIRLGGYNRELFQKFDGQIQEYEEKLRTVCEIRLIL